MKQNRQSLKRDGRKKSALCKNRNDVFNNLPHNISILELLTKLFILLISQIELEDNIRKEYIYTVFSKF